jgi:tRNA 5-methylaminomethyl-2-thiouridine biosynthesis bifunctional protein
MTEEPIQWLDDGTPFSPRFGDRYRSSQEDGLAQARDVFLHGCGLPAAWAGQPQWCVLETGFGLGLNFLVTWAAWRADPGRPRLLHFVSVEAWPVRADDLVRNATAHAGLLPLARQLAAQFHGLLPGTHRLAFEDGQVMLTLLVGEVHPMLRRHAFTADSIYLDGFGPQHNAAMWSEETLKAVARHCRHGTQAATWTVASSVRRSLVQCGFEVRKVAGVPPKRSNLQAVFAPRWQPKAARGPRLHAPRPELESAGRTCLVVGAGLAGAAVAASLARRGWTVQVLDLEDAPAGGASGLPAGLCAPHVSPDDGVLSRLSRSGVRATLAAARALLREGDEWQASGVLEHRVERGRHRAPPAAQQAAWSRPAEPHALKAAGLSQDAAAMWHAEGGWLSPAALVRALLKRPGVVWKGGTHVVRLDAAADGTWTAADANGHPLAHGDRVVVAAALGTQVLLPSLPLQPVRGTVSWQLQGDTAHSPPLLPFPVNGYGSFIPSAPLPGGRGWVMGSTFERGVSALPPDEEALSQARTSNLEHLRLLLPSIWQSLGGNRAAPRSWSGVRCTAPDRLPAVGPVPGKPGLWVCTAMGSRGLTFAVLCGELLAARMHGEPLPVDDKLAWALASERFMQGSTDAA